MIVYWASDWPILLGTFFFKDTHFIWNQQSFPSLSFLQTYIILGLLVIFNLLRIFLAAEAVIYQLINGLGVVCGL